MVNGFRDIKVFKEAVLEKNNLKRVIVVGLDTFRL
jgi:hypothetical protein